MQSDLFSAETKAKIVEKRSLCIDLENIEKLSKKRFSMSDSRDKKVRLNLRLSEFGSVATPDLIACRKNCGVIFSYFSP